MFTFINASVIFAFGLVITGIAGLGIMQARELAERAAKVEAFEREQSDQRRRVA